MCGVWKNARVLAVLVVIMGLIQCEMNDRTASVVTPVQHYTCHSRRGMFLR